MKLKKQSLHFFTPEHRKYNFFFFLFFDGWVKLEFSSHLFAVSHGQNGRIGSLYLIHELITTHYQDIYINIHFVIWANNFLSCQMTAGDGSCNVCVIAVDVLKNKAFCALLLALSQFDLSLLDIRIKEL